MHKLLAFFMFLASFNISAMECYIIDPEDIIELKTVDDLFTKLPEYIKQTHPLYTDKKRYKRLLKSLKTLQIKEEREKENLDRFLIINFLIIQSVMYDLQITLDCSLSNEHENNSKDPLKKQSHINKI